MTTVNDALWIQAAAELVILGSDLKPNCPSAKKIFIILHLSGTIIYSGWGDEMKWQLAWIKKKNWIESGSFLPAHCQVLSFTAPWDQPGAQPPPWKEQGLIQFEIKTKGTHCLSFPESTSSPATQPHNDSVQWDDVIFWPAPDASSSAAVQNFPALCAGGLYHCTAILKLCRYFTVGECILSA